MGDVALIHAGGSGVGTAATPLAKAEPLDLCLCLFLGSKGSELMLQLPVKRLASK